MKKQKWVEKGFIDEPLPKELKEDKAKSEE